jgi:hypothetical protein
MASAQAEFSKTQKIKLSKSVSAGVWQPPSNFSFLADGSAVSSFDRYPLIHRSVGAVVRTKYVGTAMQRKSSIGAEIPKCSAAFPSHKPNADVMPQSQLTSTIAVQSCDPSTVYAGYLGAPSKNLRHSASLPAIRSQPAPPALCPPITISSMGGFQRLLQQVREGA